MIIATNYKSIQDICFNEQINLSEMIFQNSVVK